MPLHVKAPLGCSTALSARLGKERLPDELLDTLARAGAQAVVLDGNLAPDLFEELALRLAARRDDLPVWAVESPCPATRAATADLASIDRAESDAACEAAEATMARIANLGAEFLLVSLGEVAALRRDWPAVRRAFLRAELTDGGRERFVAARRKAVPRHLDAARRALDRLARRAESSGLTLGIRNPTRMIGLPAVAELPQLLAHVEGAPVAPALDLAAAHLDETMGFGTVAAVLDAWRATPIALVSDACGPVVGLPPGHGEIDIAAAIAALAPETRVAFRPSPSLTIEEVDYGMKALRVATGS
jgi:hypothetical protein